MCYSSNKPIAAQHQESNLTHNEPSHIDNIQTTPTLTKEHSQIKHDHQHQDSNQQSSNDNIIDHNHFPVLPPSKLPIASALYYTPLSTTAEVISMATSTLLDDSHMSSSNVEAHSLNAKMLLNRIYCTLFMFLAGT